MSTQATGFPDRKELSSLHHRSCSFLSPPNSLHLCIFSGCVTLDTVSPCLRSMQLQSNMMDIMRSLCFQSKCLRRHSLWLTPPTLPDQPENTPHTHTHTHTILHCQKLLRLGTGEFLQEIKPNWIWHRVFPIVSWTTPWDAWRKSTNIWSLNCCLEMCIYLKTNQMTIHDSLLNKYLILKMGLSFFFLILCTKIPLFKLLGEHFFRKYFSSNKL